MNEQERLQRIIDILSDNIHEMAHVEMTDENAILCEDMNGVQMVAKEIAQLFNQEIKKLAPKIVESYNELLQNMLETL